MEVHITSIACPALFFHMKLSMYVSLHSPCPSVAHSRFTTDIPPLGNKGGRILVPRRRRGTLSLPSLLAEGKVASTEPFSKGGCEPDEWSVTVMKRSDKDSLPGFIFSYEAVDVCFTPLTLSVGRAFGALRRTSLPWARSALRLMAFAAFSGSAIGRAYTCAAPFGTVI